MIEVMSDRKILVDLDNGIYTFGNESATGKTFLYKMLAKLRSRKDILCLTANTADLVDSISKIVERDDVKLLLFDCYDVYEGKFADEILALRDKVVILMDYKQGSIFGEYQNICTIELTETMLIVETYDAI